MEKERREKGDIILSKMGTIANKIEDLDDKLTELYDKLCELGLEGEWKRYKS